ncbi:MAG: hypothetical protein ABH986_04755 [archaeon]
MVSQFFADFLVQFDFWLWAMFGAIIFITIAWNKGWTRIYYLVMILGFLSMIRFIEHFYVVQVLILCWLLFMGINFFVYKWVYFGLLIALLFLGLSNPFFYLIVFAIWITIIFQFIHGSFGLLDTKNPVQSHK